MRSELERRALRYAATVAAIAAPPFVFAACLAAVRPGGAPENARLAERPVVQPLPRDLETVDVLPRSEPAQPPDESPPDPVPRPLEIPELIRVGLATDLDRVHPSCCSSVLRLYGPELELVVGPDLEISVPETAAGRGSYRLQVAALKDSVQAESLAERLGAALAQPGDVVFDASSDLFKVHVGRYPGREGAESAKLQLAGLGAADAWIVHEDRGLAEAGLLLRQSGHEVRVAGRTVRITSDDGLVSWEGMRYRGALVVYLNDRGKLNVINELPFEDYLRGVVPRELGPELYPELEALKAQAIAARTYALRNLGAEFAAESYDVCGTPRCQVYGGRDAEHPLSDRAVAETAGEILVHRDAPIDALYSATCGGHTERVETMFPDKRAPYLRPVPCLEGGTSELRARVPQEGTTLESLLARLSTDGVSFEVRRELFLETRGDLLLTHGGGHRSGLRTDAGTALFRHDGVAASSLRLAPGDPLRMVLVAGRLVALVHDVAPHAPAAAPRRERAPIRPWTRFRDEAWLRSVISSRYPGFELRGLEVAARGASGRVSRLVLHGSDEREEVLEGLAVRFTLDVPDNWFDIERVEHGGRSGWLLRGRGWGHGVGLCQLGAFAMAQRGISYRSILAHYYSGVTLSRVEPSAAPPDLREASARAAAE